VIFNESNFYLDQNEIELRQEKKKKEGKLPATSSLVQIHGLGIEDMWIIPTQLHKIAHLVGDKMSFFFFFFFKYDKQTILRRNKVQILF
jgi:hypothetical protein